MRYVFDSGIAADFISRRGLVPERVRAARARGDKVGICTPILAELVGGVLHSDNPGRNLDILRQRTVPLTLWSFDKAAAYEYGRLYAELRACGRHMQVPDIQIAAIALSLGDCVVVSKDGDLRAVPGLTVEDWSQP
jgi:tRNA(fMet)-specific endonuclease VapC